MMIDWIFSSEEYTILYHQYLREFLNTVDAQAIIAQAKELIAPYVEKDPTKFCTYEEFEKGVATLAAFCDLRSQSVARQLAGEEADVDASAITLSDMGTMNHGGGFGDKGHRCILKCSGGFLLGWKEEGRKEAEKRRRSAAHGFCCLSEDKGVDQLEYCPMMAVD